MRSVFATLLVGSIVTSSLDDLPGIAVVGASAMLVSTLTALAFSYVRKPAGVLHQREQVQSRSARVTAMTGIERESVTFDTNAREFSPSLDLTAPIIGLLALLIAGLVVRDGSALLSFRLVVGALFIGAATDTMLLGHWYLVQPGLPRDALREMLNYLIALTPIEIIVYIIPTGMISAINGTIDDGYNGILTWFWVISALATLVLGFVAKAALKERQYSAVMAVTGLTYLSILTAFSTDLIARAILHKG